MPKSLQALTRLWPETEDEALEYSIHNQRDRRNLTDADIERLVETIDKRKQRGGDRKSEEAKSKASNDAIDKSAQETAKTIGISKDKVEKTRTILDHAELGVKQEGIQGNCHAAGVYKGKAWELIF
jgi:ParB family chromosome partitioning protein